MSISMKKILRDSLEEFIFGFTKTKYVVENWKKNLREEWNNSEQVSFLVFNRIKKIYKIFKCCFLQFKKVFLYRYRLHNLKEINPQKFSQSFPTRLPTTHSNFFQFFFKATQFLSLTVQYKTILPSPSLLHARDHASNLERKMHFYFS